MKSIILIFFIFKATAAVADCQAPGQGFLETRVKEAFHGSSAETELKEWMLHSKNYEIRQNIKELDRRIKFTPQRLDREQLLDESQIKFEQAIMNTGRPSEMENFPATGTKSKVSASKGALTIEVGNLSKEQLDVLPKEVLDKLESKVKINYYYPYDKFEYLLTYEGKELPMADALLKVQKDMEASCDVRTIENAQYRQWYQKSYGGSSPVPGRANGN